MWGIKIMMTPSVGERFDPGCFDSQIGKLVDFNGGRARISGCEVSDDGAHALIALEVKGELHAKYVLGLIDNLRETVYLSVEEATDGQVP